MQMKSTVGVALRDAHITPVITVKTDAVTRETREGRPSVIERRKLATLSEGQHMIGAERKDAMPQITLGTHHIAQFALSIEISGGLRGGVPR